MQPVRVIGIKKRRSRLAGQSGWRAVIILAVGAVGCLLAAGAATVVQPRLAPAVFESDALLQVGQDNITGGTGSLQQPVAAQEVQAVAQTINTVEVARDASGRAQEVYSATDLLYSCKAAQQQDTALITIRCRAPKPETAEAQSGAMASAAVAVNDKRFEAQKKVYSDNIDAQRSSLQAQLNLENEHIAQLSKAGATADKDPQLQLAVGHANQLIRDIDQLNLQALQLPLTRRTNLSIVSGPTVPNGPSAPTPFQIMAAAAVAGLAVGVEIGFLLTRRRTGRP